jgi:hypothetical protein
MGVAKILRRHRGDPSRSPVWLVLSAVWLLDRLREPFGKLSSPSRRGLGPVPHMSQLKPFTPRSSATVARLRKDRANWPARAAVDLSLTREPSQPLTASQAVVSEDRLARHPCGITTGSQIPANTAT